MPKHESQPVAEPVAVPRRDGYIHHVIREKVLSAGLLNQLAEILDLPEDCYGIDLNVMLDEVPSLTVYRRLIGPPAESGSGG